MFKRIVFAAAVTALIAGGAILGTNLADGPVDYRDRNLPELADIDFTDTERLRAEALHDTDIVNPAIHWMWSNGDALCDLAVSGIDWGDIVRGLYLAERIESDVEIAWARGYLSGCENRRYLDVMSAN